MDWDYETYLEKQKDMKREIEEKALEKLAQVVAGDGNVTVKLDKKNEVAACEWNTQRIIVPETISKDKVENEDLQEGMTLHEDGHIMFSGNFDPKKDSIKDIELMRAKLILNVIEDVRSERLTETLYPQAIPRLWRMNKFLLNRIKQEMDDKKIKEVTTPEMALRMYLDDRNDSSHIPVENKVSKLAKKAAEICKKEKVFEKNWEECKKIAKKIYRLFADYYGQRMDQLTQMIKALEDELAKQMKEMDGKLDKNIGKLNKKIKGQMNGKPKEKDTKELEKEIDKTAKEKRDEQESKAKEIEILRQQIEALKKYQQMDAIPDPIPFENIKDGIYSNFDKSKVKLMKEERDQTFKINNPQEYEAFKKWKKMPEVLTYDYNSKEFDDWGTKEVPEPELAKSLGYKIASRLERYLQIKCAMEDRKLQGKLNKKRLREQMANYSKIINPHLFKKRKRLLPDHSVIILCDMSGSMGGQKILQAKQAWATIGHAMDKLKVNYSLRGYSTDDSELAIQDIVGKKFKDKRLKIEHLNKVGHTRVGGCNRDGDSVRNCVNLLRKQKGSKLLIVISDGQPNHNVGKFHYGGDIGYMDTLEAVKEAERKKINVIGISIDKHANDFVSKVYSEWFQFDEKLELFPARLVKVYIKALKSMRLI